MKRVEKNLDGNPISEMNNYCRKKYREETFSWSTDWKWMSTQSVDLIRVLSLS
jgi:hypothetical protein